MQEIYEEAENFAQQFRTDVQFIFSRVQHHWHKLDDKGNRVPLKYCCLKGKRKQFLCKAGFPKKVLRHRDGKLKVEKYRCRIVCQGVAAEMNLKTSGRRNALGSILGRRRCNWFSVTSAVLANVARSNTNVQCNYRVPITSFTHDKDCHSAKCCDRISPRALCMIAQRAMKQMTGYFGGYISKRQKMGKFELADGGTLFLDEIGEIDSSTQVKLLRVLGERKIERVGGNKTISIDVRLVAATNKNIPELVSNGEFREDLYYRLNVVKITLPPLRMRSEDIPLLTNAFLREFAKENNKSIKELSTDAMRTLIDYQWPGNVRELRTAIEHGVVMSNGTKITLRHLPAAIRGENPLIQAKVEFSRKNDSQTFNLANMEAKLIANALSHTNENRTEAAKLLGISRRTLQRKLKESQ